MKLDRVKAGISRFKILSQCTGRGGQRMKDAEKYWPYANQLYRDIFLALGMPLLEGEEIIESSKEEFQAGYDYQLGIDVILRPQSGTESTLQEKFLFTDWNTVTVEYYQDWAVLDPGDWFRLKAQYYFVGYDYEKRAGAFNPWILLNWASLQLATAQGRVHWQERKNDPAKVGARASFLFVKMDVLEVVAPDVIVLSSKQHPVIKDP